MNKRPINKRPVSQQPVNQQPVNQRSVAQRVVIKIGPGSFETGYAAAAQMGEEGRLPQVEIQAQLPPSPELPALYRQWQQAYWKLGLPYRLEALDGVTNVSTTTDIEICRTLSRQLREHVHHWLDGNEFRPIREKILEQLNPSDTARILLQTQDPLIQRLPWYELEFFQRYRQAEVGVCAIDYQQVSALSTRTASRAGTVRVLAVLGDATGLNITADQSLLSRLSNADVHVLKEPSREDFNQSLWDEQGWDILFFAGHSSSYDACQVQHKDDGLGQIMLNATDTLTIPQLKYALKKAIDRGLNTAIFNSCDGLGLAADLADLHIPQVLVMREPVPDPVAHAFLKGFLSAFSSGSPFYLAVREAREKLQGLEARFPCATWLPVIVQNLAETPPTWYTLQGKNNPDFDVDAGIDADVDAHIGTGSASLVNSNLQQIHQLSAVARTASLPKKMSHPSLKQTWKRGVGTGIILATALLFARQFGFLERLEIKAYDRFLRHAPTENVDSRLLIVTNTDTDIANYPNTRGNSSLSDETLLALLNKLTPLEPQLIGLDIYRAQQAVNPALAQQLANTDNLITICKAEDYTTDTSATAPPPEITDLARVGASDFVSDINSDGVLRRHLLALAPPANSPCQVRATFSTAIALRYLEDVHNIPRSDDDYLGSARLPFITDASFGGYHGVDSQGIQILLNYRILKDPTQTNCPNVRETPADCITVTDVLTTEAEQLSHLIRGRIVLLGTTAADYGDRWLTPYTRTPSLEGQTPGVFLQAQMISQLLSAATDQRALLTSWPEWQEIIWIASWAILGGLVGAAAISPKRYWLWLQLLLAEGLLLLACWLWFTRAAVWIPWIPSAIALPAAALTTQTIRSTHLSDKFSGER